MPLPPLFQDTKNPNPAVFQVGIVKNYGMRVVKRYWAIGSHISFPGGKTQDSSI
jgi:hypothetical protein